jgi:hypothetical protein
VIAMRAAQLGITLKTLEVTVTSESLTATSASGRSTDDSKLERARDHLIDAATMYREMDMRYWREQVGTEAGSRDKLRGARNVHLRPRGEGARAVREMSRRRMRVRSVRETKRLTQPIRARQA